MIVKSGIATIVGEGDNSSHWLVLTIDGALAYYESDHASEPERQLDLLPSTTVLRQSDTSLSVCVSGEEVQFAFPTAGEATAWTQSLEETIRVLSGGRPVGSSEGLAGDGVLTVRVLRAVNLTAKDRNGLSDPFVVVELGEQSHRTTVAPATLEPEWAERFTFTHSAEARFLVCDVWDHDQLGSDDFLGRAMFPLLTLGLHPVRLWAPLAKRSRKSHVSGALLVELSTTAPRSIDLFQEFFRHATSPAFLLPSAYAVAGQALSRTEHAWDTVSPVGATEDKWNAALDSVGAHCSIQSVEAGLGSVASGLQWSAFANCPNTCATALEPAEIGLLSLRCGIPASGVSGLVAPSRGHNRRASAVHVQPQPTRLDRPHGAASVLAVTTGVDYAGLREAIPEPATHDVRMASVARAGILAQHTRRRRSIDDGFVSHRIGEPSAPVSAGVQNSRRSLFARLRRSSATTPPQRSSAAPPQRGKVKQTSEEVEGRDTLSSWATRWKLGGEGDDCFVASVASWDEASACCLHELEGMDIASDTAVCGLAARVAVTFERPEDMQGGVYMRTHLGQDALLVRGTLWLTSLRILFISEGSARGADSTSDSVPDMSTWIPLSHVMEVTTAATTVLSQPYLGLSVKCLDMRTLSFLFPGEATSTGPPSTSSGPCARMYNRIHHRWLGSSNDAAFVYSSAFTAGLRCLLHRGGTQRSLAHTLGWESALCREYDRLGVTSCGWRLSRVNDDFSLCDTYPRVLAVPESVPDTLLRAVGTYRSKGRIPALCWLDPKTRVALCRCAQPLRGMKGGASAEDQALLRFISDVCMQADGNSRLFIADCRPRLNALGNQAMGKGFEDIRAYTNTSLEFLDIGNIHVMRRSLELLRKAILQGTLQTTSHAVETSGWLKHVACLLTGADRVADVLHVERTPVIVHCSDGWDRTPQVCALAQLLLDPYYRTTDGFMALFQKEFVEFGHKFAERCGFDGQGSDSHEYSPIVLQFLDATWQLMRQTPLAFEFTSELLTFLADHVYSGLFGDSICCSEAERHRRLICEQTSSLSMFVAVRRAFFTRPGYRRCRSRLVVDTRLGAVHVWDEYYLRWDRRVRYTAGALRIAKHRQGMSVAVEAAPEVAPSSVAPGKPVSRRSTESGTVWELDYAAQACHACELPFTLLRRRHHCRACGLLFCDACSAQRRRLNGSSEPERVCSACAAILDEDDDAPLPTPTGRVSPGTTMTRW